MVRFRIHSKFSVRALLLSLISLSLAACGNSGSITFRPEQGVRQSRGISVTQVPASQAQVVEFGQTYATGHTAKIQINPIKGTELTGGGYKVKLKHTVRNR